MTSAGNARLKRFRKRWQATRRFFADTERCGSGNPGEADLYRVGTVATVKQIIKLPKQILRVLVSAEERAVLNTIEFADPYLRANITIPEESDPDIAGEINREAMTRGLRDLYLDYAARMPKITKDMVNQIKEITELKRW